MDGFWLKMWMCALMLLDHIYYFLPGMPLWFTVAGRLVAPVFVFLMTEGMRHTRDRSAYIRRMLTAGAAMVVLQMATLLILGDAPDNSILMSLGIAAALIAAVDRYRESGGVGGALRIGILLLLCIPFEGAFFCPLLAVIFYYLRERPVAMCLGYCGASVALSALFGSGVQLFMALALVPIFLYNGRRGRNGAFAKYFFYVFYPAHIYVLFFLARAI